jgi:hypothetical protein
MNFKFTWKTTLIFTGALLASALLVVVTHSNIPGLIAMVIVCSYLASRQRPKKDQG